MASQIDTETKRKRLATRHAPYWEKVSKGRSIGFRKGAKQHAWMGRIDVGGKLKYTTFDHSENWNYEEALESVTEWFSTMLDVDTSAREMNVKDAIDHYEQRMCIEKTPRYAQENAGRVRKHLSNSFATTKLAAITKKQILLFRDSMVVKSDDEEVVRKSKTSANRVLNILKAVLNLAYADNLISKSKRDEWRLVKPFENVGEARKLYLTDKQVRDFLKWIEKPLPRVRPDGKPGRIID